jgi:Leucine-rich repeat (LRR) protein
VSGTAIKGLPPSIVRLKNLYELFLEGCGGLSPKRSNLLLSTLSALPSFTELNLSYCNIRAIPDVFGCFPSLKDLNLSGNNFVCLPKSIILLSNLEFLI